MRKFFAPVIIVGFFFASCSQKDIVAPQTASNNFFYKDASVAVPGLALTEKNAKIIDIAFSTLYEKGVTKIELMSSGDKVNFCSVYVITLTENSQIQKNYVFSDNNIKSSTMHYMFRFTFADGSWSFSDYNTIEVK